MYVLYDICLNNHLMINVVVKTDILIRLLWCLVGGNYGNDDLRELKKLLVAYLSISDSFASFVAVSTAAEQLPCV